MLIWCFHCQKFVGWKCKYLLYLRPRAALVGGSAPLVLLMPPPPKSGTSLSLASSLFALRIVSSTMINGTAARKLAQTASMAGARYVFLVWAVVDTRWYK